MVSYYPWFYCISYVWEPTTSRGPSRDSFRGDFSHKLSSLSDFSKAKVYCCKEDTRITGPWTFGDDSNIPESQGVRSDWNAVKRKFQAGASVREVALDDAYTSLYARNPKGFKSLKALVQEPRNAFPEIITLYGETGVGKSRWANLEFSDSIYRLPPPKSSGTWWSRYDNEETVLIDEMYGNRFKHGPLLMLLDQWPCTVPDYGADLVFNSPRIIFTSNSPPEDWYRNLPYEGGALHRRLTEGLSRVYRVDMFQQFVLEDGPRDAEGVLIPNPLQVIGPLNQ